MKINRRNFLAASSAILLAHNQLPSILANAEPESSVFSPAQKEVAVYTTADKTDYRISATDKLSFKAVGQPKETQICVFVDPGRQFQTFLGIGGALTDASAETFAMLPKAKQKEFLDAHFDETRGIGYKLARTNIHSCDFSSGSYTYIDEGDKDLMSFSVAHDK
jgi:glucosylceramidase